MEAIKNTDRNAEFLQMIGAVAYRSAETAELLSLIFGEYDPAGVFYNILISLEHCCVLSSNELLRPGPLASEQACNTWKHKFFGELQSVPSSYAFVSELVEEFEAIAEPLWSR